MFQKCLILLLTACVLLPAGTLLVEDFNDVSTLPGNGWVLTNLSSPLGETGWFQGNPDIFPAQAGDPSAYIAANYLNAGYGGTVDNWLFTPVLPMAYQMTLSFYTRTEGAIPGDSLQVLYSTSGASTDIANFAVMMTIPPEDYPIDWTPTPLTASLNFATPSTGRFAFRYMVADTSVGGDYIGIDTVSASQTVPEPGTLALLGIAGAGLLLWRKAKKTDRRAAAAVLGAVLVVGAALPCSAADAPKKTKKTAAKVEPKPAPAAGGARIFIDPATGKTREPEQEELRQLAPQSKMKAGQAKMATTQPQAITGPNGATGMKVDESVAMYSVAVRNPDGTISFQCVQGKAAADKTLATPAPAGGENNDR